MVAGIALGSLAALAPGEAAADVTVASSAGGALYIHRVGEAKVDKLFEEQGKGVVAYGYSDAKTLWVVRKAGAGYTIGKVVDGKAEAGKALTLQMATPGNEVPSGTELKPGLVTTKGGQVLVTTCLGLDPKATGPLMKCEIGYQRVDDGSNAFSKVRPKDVVFEFGRTKPARPTALKKAPKGYNVKIVKTKHKNGQTYTGFECTGPGDKKLRWPTDADPVEDDARFTPKVNKATWLSETPVLVHIEANGTTPVGEKLHEEWYVVDCSTTIGSVRGLRDGLWLTDDSVRKPSGDVVGKLPGDDLVLAP